MANTGEIQDLTVSWEGYAGTSVEAFIKKEFTSALSGDVGIPVENYTSSGSIMPISKVYTLDGLCVTPIVENVSGALNETTTVYFPHFYKESSFQEIEKLEFYVFDYSNGRWSEPGYHYRGTEDNLPSWVIGQIISKLPTATTSTNGLMSSTDKGKLDNAVTVQPQTFTNEQKAQAQTNIGIVIDDNPTYNSQNLVKSGGVKASVDYVYINSVGIREQTFTDEQKTQARTNIGAASASALNEKADKTTVKENERVVAEALNDLESRKANTNDVYTKAQTDSAISEYTYNKTTTDNLLNNKVDKIAGKGLSTNDFTVIELSDYTSSDDELPTDDNLIYTYHGQVVEKRMCKLDGDNDAILFIANRDLSDLEMDDLVVLAYIRSGGGDYKYEFDATYHTTYSNCPTWVKAACGITYATTDHAGLMSPNMYDDLLTLNEKADKTTVKENERVVAEALNDLESRKANTSDVYTKAQTDNLLNAKADTTSLGGLTLVKLTQAEYDALTTKDSNKLYIIVG